MLGPNATNPRALDQYCKALVVTKKLIDSWDNEVDLMRRSGKHFAKAANKDLKKLVNQLMEKHALQKQPGRKLVSYRNPKPSLIARGGSRPMQPMQMHRSLSLDRQLRCL